ncbi:hypothetical protein [Actinomadura madurae]|uniref:hypothetical protein n=1 Tax=Actinomadura madurae TaxID=1993 RepID=UPI000D9872CF|nr:hypothetical protein [Actinomadura madurae]SPT51261.1 Uncharacterised protein [Actinomadura madurae]
MATPATATGLGDFVTAGPDWPERAEHMRMAAQAIAVSFARFHLADVLERLNHGGEVDFGAFIAIPDGLRHRDWYGHKVKPWRQVFSAEPTSTVDLESLRQGREMFTVRAAWDVLAASWGRNAGPGCATTRP